MAAPAWASAGRLLRAPRCRSPAIYEPSHVATKHGEKIKPTYSSHFSRGQCKTKENNPNKKRKETQETLQPSQKLGAFVQERSRARLLEALVGQSLAPCPGRGDSTRRARRRKVRGHFKSPHREAGGTHLGDRQHQPRGCHGNNWSKRSWPESAGIPGKMGGSRGSHPIPSRPAGAQPTPGTPTAWPGSQNLPAQAHRHFPPHFQQEH